MSENDGVCQRREMLFDTMMPNEKKKQYQYDRHNDYQHNDLLFTLFDNRK